jgi:hypothetical protein
MYAGTTFRVLRESVFRLVSNDCDVTFSISRADVNHRNFEKSGNLMVQETKVGLNSIETLFVRDELRFA